MQTTSVSRRSIVSAATIPLVAAWLTFPAPPAAADCAEGTSLGGWACASVEVTVDALATLRGGVRQDAAAIGRAKLSLDTPEEGLFGMEGWSAHLSGFAIYGRQPAATLTGSLAPPSNIEALSTVRLFELWVQRDLGGWGSLRAGQLAADEEFATAGAAGNLINGTFGWPVILAGALPSGGPAYPLATPGIRLALGDPEAATGLRIGVFSGDPGGRYGDDTDPQRHNRYGTNFSTSGGTFIITEAVVGAPAPEDDKEGPRPWVAKVGFWYHTGGFDSQRLDSAGLSLADPASSGVPRRYGDNLGGYAIGEATVWRGEGSSVAVFARLFGAPANRNLISAQLDSGVAWRGPFGRADDTLSFGVSMARVGDDARALDRDRQAQGEDRVTRDMETVLELNYDYAVIPGQLSLRPVVQWIIHPAAREPDDRVSTTRPLKDAVLVGLRATATF